MKTTINDRIVRIKEHKKWFEETQHILSMKSNGGTDKDIWLNHSQIIAWFDDELEWLENELLPKLEEEEILKHNTIVELEQKHLGDGEE